MKKSLIAFVLLALLLSGCISANSRVGINKDRSVDIIYTTILSKDAVGYMTDLGESVTQLQKYGFKVTQRTKANGDQIITATTHLVDLSDLRTLKINDTTPFLTNYSAVITKNPAFDQLVMSGKLPVLDPPETADDSASAEIKSRLTLKLPYKVTANDADIIDGNTYEWEGNDATPAVFHVTVQLPKVVVPTKINVGATASVAKGATLTLKPVLIPANVTNKTLRYSSSNTAIATVTTTGVVKGIAAGSAVITIWNADKTVKATVTVTVK